MGGHRDVIESLYRDFGPALFAYARSLLREASSAEDVVHEVFLKLIARPGWLPVEPRPYLFRAVRNASLNRRRSVSREAGRPPEAPAFVAEDGLAALVPDLERALADLPVEQCEVVMLRVWGGLTLEAAAEVAGVSPNTAASRYRYGMARLRERFGMPVKENTKASHG